MNSPYVISESTPFRLLSSAFTSGRMHHAYLLTGPDGTGKAAMALHFALAMLCRGSGAKPCLACSACRKALDYAHPDLRLLFPFVSPNVFKTVLKTLGGPEENEEPGADGEEAGEKSARKIKTRKTKKTRAPARKTKEESEPEETGEDEESRAGDEVDETVTEAYDRYLYDAARQVLKDPFRPAGLTEDFRDKNREISIARIRQIVDNEIAMPPSESPVLTYVIPEADRMNRSAANAFLKTLEEPPRYVRFFLITSRPNALPATIRSRCQEIKMPPLTEAEIRGFLSSSRGVPAAEAALAASFADGSIRNALDLADPGLELIRSQALDLLDWFGRPSQKEALDLAEGWRGAGPADHLARLRFAALILRKLLRADPFSSDGDFAARYNRVAAVFPRELIPVLFDRLMAARDSIERNASPKMVNLAMLLSFL